MQNAERRKQHGYRVSYAIEVGSSVDPDMEDVAGWEDELRGTSFAPMFRLSPRESTYVPSTELHSNDSSAPDFVPDGFDQQELEEYEAIAEFADLEELPDDFWSDTEDSVSGTHPPPSSSPSVSFHSVGREIPGSTDIEMS